MNLLKILSCHVVVSQIYCDAEVAIEMVSYTTKMPVFIVSFKQGDTSPVWVDTLEEAVSYVTITTN